MGASASTEPLSFGVDADSFSKEQESSSKSITSSSAACSSSSVLLNSTSSDGSKPQDFLNVDTDSIIEEEPIKQSSSTKRKSDENQVPRLIENKQKHLEKNIVCCTKKSAISLNHCMEFLSQ